MPHTDLAGPRVSIVTPSYQQGRFLRRTIESVLAQTYPHIEYLVIDGGSTDESLAILKSYDDRFYWTSEPDRGQTDAINKGFARSQGEIRAFLNSDDVLLPDAVAIAAAEFTRQLQWDMIYGQALNIDAQDRVLDRFPTTDFSRARLLHASYICQPATFWRTRMAERIGPLDDSLHFAMDYEYWLRIAAAGGQIVHVPRLLACNRQHPETKTLSSPEKLRAEIRAVRRRYLGCGQLTDTVSGARRRLRPAPSGRSGLVALREAQPVHR